MGEQQVSLAVYSWILFQMLLHSLFSFRNCLFRSLADQLEGDHNRHGQIRRNTVHFMRSNREDFEPFHDGEGTFNEYCKYCIKRSFFVLYFYFFFWRMH